MKHIELDRTSAVRILTPLLPASDHVRDVTITPLGSGENHTNLLVTVNHAYRYVFRIANNVNGDSLTAEFDILSRLPPGIAPVPLLLDISSKIVPWPFMVQSFVKGKRNQRWSELRLEQLATAMASYHSITSAHFGSISPENRPDKRAKSLTLTTYLGELNDFFIADSPTLRTHPDLKDLYDGTIRFLINHQSLFDDFKNYSLIHADCTPENILFEGETVHIVDWELAMYGDPANDFATFFYDDMAYHNWRVKLSPSQRVVLVNAYLKNRPDPTLDRRISVWLAFDKCCSLTYCLWKRENYEKHTGEGMQTLSKEQLTEEIAKLQKSLRTQISR